LLTPTASGQNRKKYPFQKVCFPLLGGEVRKGEVERREEQVRRRGK